MSDRTAVLHRLRPDDDLAEDEPSSVKSLIQGILYWGILGLGFAVPIAGGIWGMFR